MIDDEDGIDEAFSMETETSEAVRTGAAGRSLHALCWLFDRYSSWKAKWGLTCMW